MLRNATLALLALAAAVFVLPSAASAAAPAVTTANVNLRAGPSTGYPAVTVIPAGAPISTFGCLGDYSWCDVAWGANRGWIAASYIQIVYGGRPVVLTPAIAPAVGLAVVAFNRAYWDRYYVGRPWYPRWGYYYGPGVTRSGSVACGGGSCSGTVTTVGPRGRGYTRSGTVTRY